jgi:hypothetical protein
MRNIIVLTIFILGRHLFAQGGTPSIIPQYPTPNDSIMIVTTTTVRVANIQLSKTFTVFPMQYSITLETCYYEDGFWVGNLIKLDTFLIGKMSAGTYKATFKTNFSYDDNNPTICLPGVVSKVTFTFNVTTDVSIEKKIEEFGFRIYPTIIQDKINIDLVPWQILNFEMDIENAMGQIFFRQKILNDKEEIDLSFLSTGIYYIKIQNNLGQSVFRILKN